MLGWFCVGHGNEPPHEEKATGAEEQREAVKGIQSRAELHETVFVTTVVQRQDMADLVEGNFYHTFVEKGFGDCFASLASLEPRDRDDRRSASEVRLAKDVSKYWNAEINAGNTKDAASGG